MGNKDSEKSKEALLDELNRARQNISTLEAKVAIMEKRLNQPAPDPKARKPREQLQSDIEFIADFDVVEARGIDMSDGGVCFEVERNLAFDMRFRLEGEVYEKRATLVWVKRLPEGNYRLGFEFVAEPPEGPEF